MPLERDRKIYLPKPFCPAGHRRGSKNTAWTLAKMPNGTERLTIRCRACMSVQNALRYKQRRRYSVIEPVGVQPSASQ